MKITKEVFEHLIKVLDKVDNDNHLHDWYEYQFPVIDDTEWKEQLKEDGVKEEDLSEDELLDKPYFLKYLSEKEIAEEAIKDETLHHHMELYICKLIEKMTTVGEIYYNMEHTAGDMVALQLALYSVEYIPLFVSYLSVNDLDHEVFQNEHMIQVINKWGINEYTYPVIVTRILAGGQLSYDVLGKKKEIQEKLKDEQEREKFLISCKEWMLVLNRKRTLTLFTKTYYMNVFEYLFIWLFEFDEESAHSAADKLITWLMEYSIDSKDLKFIDLLND